jgi:hypothetical protein
MADGVNIDWSLAQPKQNYAETYANAFALGRQVAGQQIQGNALTAYAANPTAPVDPRLMAANPELGLQLQGRQQDAQDQGLRVQQATALAGGDTQGAADIAARRGATGDVMTLMAQKSDEERQAAKDKAEATAGAVYAVKTAIADPAQRVPVLQHMAQMHPEYGIDPASITPETASDANLNGIIGQALGLKGQIEMAQKEADQKREAAAQQETVRHDQADEATATGRLGVERGQLGVAQSRLALERQEARAGGKLTPPAAMAPAPAAGPGGAPAQGVPIAQVPAEDRAIVQALIDGRYPIPSGAALRNPQMVKYLQEAAQVDPTFDAANAGTRVATRKDFTSGKSAQTITSLNQALGHAALVASDIQHLGNSDIPVLGNGLNYVKNALNPGPTTDFRTHAGALAVEAAKVFQGGVPHEGEVQALTKIIADPNATPTQQRSAVASLTELLGSRLDALKGQYQQGMGKSSTPLEVLHPGAAAAYSRLSHLRGSFGTTPQVTAPPGHGSPDDAALLAKYGVH